MAALATPSHHLTRAQTEGNENEEAAYVGDDGSAALQLPTGAVKLKLVDGDEVLSTQQLFLVEGNDRTVESALPAK